MLRQVAKTSLLLLLVLIGFVGGIFFQRHIHVNGLLINLGMRQPFNIPPSSQSPLRAASLPDLRDNETAFVGLVLGQSNAGSHGIANRDVALSDNAYQFWQGGFYPAHDPLFGSSGDGGSIWLSLTPELLNEYPSVVWAATVVGATSIKAWIPHGRFHVRMQNMLDAIESQSLPVDAVFWIQGELDAQDSMTQAEYYSSLVKLIDVIAGNLPDTPIYLAKATRCYQHPPYAPIRAAVDQAVANFPQVRAGIDLDEIDLSYRFDGCHLTLEGQQLAALRWHELLRAAE